MSTPSPAILAEIEQELSTGVGLAPRDVHQLVGRWSRNTICHGLRQLVREGRALGFGTDGHRLYVKVAPIVSADFRRAAE